MVKDEIEKITGFKLEAIENPDFGDYSSNIAMAMFSKSQSPNSKFQTSFKIQKDKFKNPQELAEELVKEINSKPGLPALAEAKAGFINFWLKNDVLVDNLIQINREKEKYGASNLFKGQRLMFEYAHPNTHKAFHIGHLRNITTGETLVRLAEFAGARVVRVNYQGDIGLHIAKALWGIGKLGFSDPKDVKKRAEFLGKAYAKGATAYEEDEKAKEEIHEINAKIYGGSDKELGKLYKQTRQWSLDYFDEIYKRVYTKFDRFYFESEVAESGKQIAEKAAKDGILKKSKGAIIFPGSEYGLHDRVFISGKGVPTYEAKDLGLAKLQFSEYEPDKLIHTVGPEQIAYFQVIFKVLELVMPETKGREVHVPYGWVRLKEGKMASRTGNVVLGEWLLDEAKNSIKKMFDTEEEIAEQIAVGAVKYSFLKTGLTQDIAFDLKESISLEGNSGPYLQYTIARINSVLVKAPTFKDTVLHAFDPEAQIRRGESSNLNLNEEELSVLRSLIRFSEITETVAENYSPNLLCNYLYDLAQKYNSFYNIHRIIGDVNQESRIMLTAGVGQVLKNGLELLGIQAPQRM